jgi:hypothetical protein
MFEYIGGNVIVEVFEDAAPARELNSQRGLDPYHTQVLYQLRTAMQMEMTWPRHDNAELADQSLMRIRGTGSPSPAARNKEGALQIFVEVQTTEFHSDRLWENSPMGTAKR